MIEITPHNQDQRANEADLLRLEQSLSTKLPDDYHAFLVQTNGGKASPNVVAWGDGAYQNSSVRHFLHIR